MAGPELGTAKTPRWVSCGLSQSDSVHRMATGMVMALELPREECLQGPVSLAWWWRTRWTFWFLKAIIGKGGGSHVILESLRGRTRAHGRNHHKTYFVSLEGMDLSNIFGCLATGNSSLVIRASSISRNAQHKYTPGCCKGNAWFGGELW